MKWLYKFLLIISLSSPVYAESSPATELSGLLTAIQTMQANFTQDVLDNRNKPIQRSNGKMAIQRPDKFRWEVTQPIPQLIISNQSRLWIYDPDLEQVTIRSLKKAVGEAPTMLLNYSDVALKKEYVITVLPKKSSSLQWFNLTPKNSDNMFVAVQLGFVNGMINQMKLHDHLGHMTLIQFKNIKANIALPSNLFTFKVPKGVDVIDETR